MLGSISILVISGTKLPDVARFLAINWRGEEFLRRAILYEGKVFVARLSSAECLLGKRHSSGERRR